MDGTRMKMRQRAVVTMKIMDRTMILRFFRSL